MANPPSTPGLDLAGERRRIEEAFRSSPGVHLSFLEHADGNGLRRQVRHGKFHIVHFMGHGAFDEGEATGALILESPEGPADLLSDKTFAGLFTGIVLPVLVVLNACHTGKVAELSGRDPFAGVAAALVQEGLPAVLAMRSTIRDSAALALSEELYSRLAAGDPVEAALAEARLALSTSDPAAVDWAIPALFMRAAARTASQDLLTAGAIGRPVEPLAPPAVEPQGTRSEAPSFVQKIKTKRIGEQINIGHADAVHLTDRGDSHRKS
jgi:CHAT domain-containing protein